MGFDSDDKFQHPVPHQSAPLAAARDRFEEWYGGGWSDNGRKFFDNMGTLMTALVIMASVVMCTGLLSGWLFSNSSYEVQAVKVTVEQGDTLFAIADRYKVDRGFMLDLNEKYLGYNLKVCSSAELSRSYNEGGREQYACRNATLDGRQMAKFNTLYPGDWVLVPLANWENSPLRDPHDIQPVLVMLDERPPSF